MLKKYLHIIFSISLSLFFVIAGSGFNIVNYCCNVCEDEGIEHVAGKSCHAVHTQNDTCCEHGRHDTAQAETTESCDLQTDDYACSDMHHKTDKCHLLRIAVDLPVLNATLYNDIDTAFEIVGCIDFSINAIFSDVSFIHNDLAPPEILLVSSGRTLLLQKAVLII